MAATRARVLYQAAFGKAEVWRERPMTADALFRIASMTKAVTSVAAMQADTFFNVPESRQAHRVTVHQRQNGPAGTPLVEQPNQPRLPATTFNGGGGLTSTASDYIRFSRMILNGGALDGARILSADTVALMARNQLGRHLQHVLLDRSAARHHRGRVMMQLLPFADAKALAIYAAFERGVYQLADAPLKSNP